MPECIECSQEIRPEEKAVEYHIGFMHYYQCSIKKKAEPTGGFIRRIEGTFVPQFLIEGRRIW